MTCTARCRFLRHGGAGRRAGSADAGRPRRLPLPEGTQGGKTFRLRGKGIKGVRSGYPGDLYVHVNVETPVKLTEAQKDMLREFDRSVHEGGSRHSPQEQSWLDKVKSFFS